VEYWVNQEKDYRDNMHLPEYSKQKEILENKYGGSFLEMNKTYMSKREYENCKKVLA